MVTGNFFRRKEPIEIKQILLVSEYKYLGVVINPSTQATTKYLKTTLNKKLGRIVTGSRKLPL